MPRHRRRPNCNPEDAQKNDERWARYVFDGYLKERRTLTEQASIAQEERIVNTEQILEFLRSPDNRKILEKIGGVFSEKDGVTRLDYAIGERKFNIQVPPGINVQQDNAAAVVLLLQELGIDFLKFIVVRLDNDELARFIRTDPKGQELLSAIEKWKLGRPTEHLRVTESAEKQAQQK